MRAGALGLYDLVCIRAGGAVRAARDGRLTFADINKTRRIVNEIRSHFAGRELENLSRHERSLDEAEAILAGRG